MIHPLCAWLVIGVVSIFLLLHQLWNAPSSPVAAPYSRLDFGSHPYIRFITTNAVQKQINQEKNPNKDWSALVDRLNEKDAIGELRHQNYTTVEKPMSNADDFFKDYRSYKRIKEFLTSLTVEENVDLINIGKSWNDRDILGLYLHFGDESQPRRKIVILGGQHGREWVSISTCLYIAYELVKKNAIFHDVLNEFDFYIIPLLNPDGYEFAREKDRLWRKNLQPVTSDNRCFGIDLNHNWNNHWGKDHDGSNPCSETYHGAQALSALETYQLDVFMKGLKKVVGFFDLHSFGQNWLYPMAYNCTIPRDIEDLEEVSLGAVRAINYVHGIHFDVSQACKFLYDSCGNAVDWAYETKSIKYSFHISLRDTGAYGFLLPPEYIIPSAEEALAGLLYASYFIKERETG